MTPSDLLDLGREAIMLSLLLALPVLAAALAANLVVGALQSLAGLSEPAMSLAPRVVAVLAVLVATAPWLAARVAAFAERVWSLIPAVPG
ncbi:MAG: flagellar biosynthetic protein FliQ [Deltaproteobacteria bacterium]|nr:flagellar biosynthetic protein FliQ [Deltaproteobacteria bacterium]